jgi:SAM-dependent methyltransferase
MVPENCQLAVWPLSVACTGVLRRRTKQATETEAPRGDEQVLPPDGGGSVVSPDGGGSVVPVANVLSSAEWLRLAAEGRCNICGGQGTIEVPADAAQVEDVGALRESLVCRGCGAISRDRALILGLAAVLGERAPLANWASRPHQRMFETSGYRGHPRFLGDLFEYYNLPYEPPPERDSGKPLDPHRGADIQDMHFPDGFFDVVMTAEVLEHVPDEKRAISEIARVLAPGGHLVLEVPYVHAWERTSSRVHRWHDRDVHLAPPEYHAEHTLVYRIYGRDLLSALATAGLTVAHLDLEMPGLGITQQSVIVATKGPYVDLTALRFVSWVG